MGKKYFICQKSQCFLYLCLEKRILTSNIIYTSVRKNPNTHLETTLDAQIPVS